MRAPFAYENNAFLIRDILVPDPLRADEWERLRVGWETDGGQSSLLEWMIREGSLTERTLLGQLADAGGVEIFDGTPLEEAARGADREVLEANGFVVLGRRAGKGLVTGGPDFPPDLRPYIGERAGNWQWVLISPLRAADERTAVYAYSHKGGNDPRTSLESWLKDLLQEARLGRTADIHFERTGDRLLVRTRTDRGMQDLSCIGPPRSAECMRYLKRLAGFTTADNPLPQDGRIRLGNKEQEQVYRASHIRTVAGESLVLRTIGESEAVPSLERLGIPGELATLLREAVWRDSGLVLCTGATGSGKSTTLFSLLKEVAQASLKILSIEDPVELEIPEVIQSSVDVERGWTFPAALRAYLRQDPDIIFVGEIRDKASAEGAVRAALTGHVVLSTLHASSPLAALDRLRGWGLQAGLIAETVRLVSHQRLIDSAANSGRTAEFQWLRINPDAVYGYLCEGIISDSLGNARPLQELSAPSAKA